MHMHYAVLYYNTSMNVYVQSGCLLQKGFCLFTIIHHFVHIYSKITQQLSILIPHFRIYFQKKYTYFKITFSTMTFLNESHKNLIDFDMKKLHCGFKLLK